MIEQPLERACTSCAWIDACTFLMQPRAPGSSPHLSQHSSNSACFLNINYLDHHLLTPCGLGSVSAISRTFDCCLSFLKVSDGVGHCVVTPDPGFASAQTRVEGATRRTSPHDKHSRWLAATLCNFASTSTMHLEYHY